MAKTERLIYSGRYECGVDVNLDDGRWQHVPHGGEFVTTAAHAESLLTQEGEWTRASTKKRTQEENDG